MDKAHFEVGIDNESVFGYLWGKVQN
jgi:hypothetical protein